MDGCHSKSPASPNDRRRENLFSLYLPFCIFYNKCGYTSVRCLVFFGGGGAFEYAQDHSKSPASPLEPLSGFLFSLYLLFCIFYNKYGYTSVR